LCETGLKIDDNRRAQRRKGSESRKEARAARKLAMEGMEVPPVNRVVPAPPPQVAPSSDIADMLSAERFDEFSTKCLCVAALFLLFAFLQRCRREIEAAMRVTMRRATPQTAEHVFISVLLEKIEKRFSRREADKLRKRRTRNLAAALAT
jgi:hypothetical protein